MAKEGKSIASVLGAILMFFMGLGSIAKKCSKIDHLHSISAVRHSDVHSFGRVSDDMVDFIRKTTKAELAANELKACKLGFDRLMKVVSICEDISVLVPVDSQIMDITGKNFDHGFYMDDGENAWFFRMTDSIPVNGNPVESWKAFTKSHHFDSDDTDNYKVLQVDVDNSKSKKITSIIFSFISSKNKTNRGMVKLIHFEDHFTLLELYAEENERFDQTVTNYFKHCLVI